MNQAAVYVADARALDLSSAALRRLIERFNAMLVSCNATRSARSREAPSGGRRHFAPVLGFGRTAEEAARQDALLALEQAAARLLSNRGGEPQWPVGWLDITALVRGPGDSIAPWGAPFAEPGHGINEARQAEGLPPVSETGPGNQTFSSPDSGGAAATAGAPAAPLFGETFGGPSPIGSNPSARVGSDPNARVGSDPNAKVGSDPGAKVGSDPLAALFGVNSAQVGSDPFSNVGSDPNAPVGTGG